jgi:DDE_Tnp_1-associated/Transposase DDE domain
MPALSLVEALAEVPDPRSPHGRIHPLPAVLSLVVLGLLLGRTSLSGIARLGRLYGAPLAHALGFRRGKTPTKAMLSELLRALDAEAFEGALSRWVRSRLTHEPEHLSLDGKTLRGSRDGAVPGQHLVAVYAPVVEAVLAQVRVDAKTNEHKAALQLLGLIPLAGRVVVGDAMFCQRDLAEQVVGAGGDYVLVAKENQPTLQRAIAAAFGYEASQRSIAAAFSPRRPAPAGAAPGEHHRQGTRPGREAHPADDDVADRARAVAGVGAGL